MRTAAASPSTTGARNAMLLVLVLAHLLSNGTRAGATQAQKHILYARTTNSTDDADTRSLYDLVWGCLTTIFACTWVSVHPNISPPAPPRPSGAWGSLKWAVMTTCESLGRQLLMMLVTVIAPELMVGFAARQFLAAWKYSTEYDISWTHGYFISMGGFITRDGHPVVLTEQLDRQEYMDDIRDVREEAIKDKSKRDPLSKGVAILQGVWFVTQVLARLVQGLPVTALETATLAFAVVNIFIWILWWRKPFGVEDPIPIGPPAQSDLGSPSATQEKPGYRDLNIVQKLFAFALGKYEYSRTRYDPRRADSVPLFWSSDESVKVKSKKIILSVLGLELTVGTIFGAIHCAAWNTPFGSSVEQSLWRICAIGVTAIPVVTPLFPLAAKYGLKDSQMPDGRVRVGPRVALFATLSWLGGACYVVARIFLLVLPFIALRTIPPAVLLNVDWSGFIPHV